MVESFHANHRRPEVVRHTRRFAARGKPSALAGVLRMKSDAESGQSATSAQAGTPACDCALHAVIHGAWRFLLVSLGGFGVWAGAGRWFYRNTGELGLYLASAVVFVGLAGLFMHPLLAGANRLRRFYAVFTPAFFGYAAAWCVFWFLWRDGPGEWTGSLAGSVVFCLLARWRLHSTADWILPVAVFFATHSAGYFSGGQAMAYLLSPDGAALLEGWSRAQIGLAAKMSWGALYGLGFGAGMGFVFHRLQQGGRT